MQIEIQSNNKTLSLKTDFKGTNLLIIWKIVVGFKFLQSIFIQMQYSKKIFTEWFTTALRIRSAVLVRIN